MISGILLAAGRSTRMGSVNKLFLDVNGEAMLYQTIAQLSRTTIRELIVVVNTTTNQLIDTGKLTNCKKVVNPHANIGMTTSIQVGVAACSPYTSGYLICMADQPFLSTKDYNHIIHHFYNASLENKHCILVPYYQSQKGNPVLFSNIYQKAILAHPPHTNGCKVIVQANSQHIHRLEMTNQNILLDIDTPTDYSTLS